MAGSVARFAKVGCGPHNTGTAQVFALGVDKQARSTPLPWGSATRLKDGLYAAAYDCGDTRQRVVGKHDKQPRKSTLMRGEGNVVRLVQGARDT